MKLRIHLSFGRESSGDGAGATGAMGRSAMNSELALTRKQWIFLCRFQL